MMVDPSGSTGVMIRDYRKGNWTITETMVLIEAKKMNDERRMKRVNGGGGVSSATASSSANKAGELRWKWVEDYCWRKGCFRSQNQCNDKWDNLMRDYKKVRDHHRRIASSAAGEAEAGGGGSYNSSKNKSYWKMDKVERKERNLPSNMLLQIYEALVDVVERPGGGDHHRLAAAPASGGGGGSSSSGGGGMNTPVSNVNQVSPMEISTAIVQHQPTAVTAGVVMPRPLPPLLSHHPHHHPPITVLPLPPPPPPPMQSQQQVAPPPPPPPPHLVTQLHHYPIPTMCDAVGLDSDDEDRSGGDDEDYSDSPAKRRRRSSPGGGEAVATVTAAVSSASLPEEISEVGRAISRSATAIAAAIQGSEEREERRHRDMVSLQERRLKIEESKMEISRHGINGLVDAINNLSHSILALASSSSSSSSPRDRNKNQNQNRNQTSSSPK